MSNLKNDLEGLEKGLISRAMKTLLYIIPMYLLSTKLYVLLAHNDAIFHCGFSFNNFMSDLNGSAFLWSFVFFCILFLFSYWCEIFLFPNCIIGFYDKFYSKKEMDSGIKIAEHYLTKKHGYDFLKYIHIVRKYEIVTGFMYIPVTIILWMIYFNNIVSYSFIVLTIYLCFTIFKVINSCYNYYPKENLAELE